MTMPSDILLNRRNLILLGGAFVLSGCSGEAADDVSAFAFRGNEKFEFRDTVGWMELHGRVAVVGFFPRMLSPAERDAVVQQRSVYPAIEPHDPMIELRFFLRDVEEAIGEANLEAVQLTFWHFAAPAPVLKFERASFAESGLSFAGLDGRVGAGGWIVGTVRGQGAVTMLGGRTVSHTWNLSAQAHLD